MRLFWEKKTKYIFKKNKMNYLENDKIVLKNIKEKVNVIQ